MNSYFTSDHHKFSANLAMNESYHNRYLVLGFGSIPTIISFTFDLYLNVIFTISPRYAPNLRKAFINLTSKFTSHKETKLKLNVQKSSLKYFDIIKNFQKYQRWKSFKNLDVTDFHDRRRKFFQRQDGRVDRKKISFCKNEIDPAALTSQPNGNQLQFNQCSFSIYQSLFQ